jgi:SAM-dependent methyltransferase
MANSTAALLKEIEAYCQHTGIAESTFGRHAINDGKLCSRLRAGKNVTLATAERVRTYIVENGPDDLSADGPDRVARPLEAAPPDPGEAVSAVPDRPFRFYDNRQKYLAFVNTCNEKTKVAERAARELVHLRPSPPALRLFDAGMGDGTILSHLLRATHQRYPTLPFYVVGKEISLEDIRLSLETLPDRLVEHPASVFVFTNLHYREAPWLMPLDVNKAAALNWKEVELDGTSAFEFGQQLEALDDHLVDAWQATTSQKTGNPLYVRPSVLILYRKDHKFLLDSVIPRRGQTAADYDLVIASQPWRARMDAQFKAKFVLSPLTRALRPGGRLLGVQSAGDDIGLEIVQQVWPDEDPFQVNRHELLKALKDELGNEARDYNFNAYADAKSIFQYKMHTLPDEIADSIGTSTLFAAWNAAVYVAQIEDQKLEHALHVSDYLESTARVLQKHNGLWFNDESFVISRKSG